MGRSPEEASPAPGLTETMRTPSVATPIARTRPGVSGSPSTASPNRAVWTGSVLMIAVTTEKERSRMAASISAVARICAVAPSAMKARKEPFGPGIVSEGKLDDSEEDEGEGQAVEEAHLGRPDRADPLGQVALRDIAPRLCGGGREGRGDPEER
jgi:hypothetical protein